MITIFDNLAKIIGETEAKNIIKILVNHFNFYITTEEIQKLNINF